MLLYVKREGFIRPHVPNDLHILRTKKHVHRQHMLQFPYTVLYRYNAVNLLSTLHKRPHPRGRAMGCLLWVWSLLSSQCRWYYSEKPDRVITELDWSWNWNVLHSLTDGIGMLFLIRQILVLLFFLTISLRQTLFGLLFLSLLFITAQTGKHVNNLIIVIF